MTIQLNGKKPTKICMFQPSKLPAEYQEVEYIETTGTQYITTSIVPNTNTQIEVKIEVTTTAMDKTIFATNRGSTYYHLTPFSNSWYYGLNGSESHAGTYNNVIGTQYEVVYNNSNSQLSINGIEVGSTSGTTSTDALEIAKRANDNTKGVFKYFYFNVYNKNTSTYLLKLVPCYRKLDSVIGMYDLVNDTFYTNSGTGTFTKGNDVNLIEKEIKKIVIFPDGITEKQIRPTSRLPAEYQEVERIQSTGSEYINTSLILQDGYLFKMKVQYKSTGRWYNIGGYYDNGSNKRFYYGVSDNNKFCYGIGSSYSTNLASASIDTDYELEAKLWNGSQYFKVNGTTLDSRSMSFSTSAQYPVRIFAETNSGGASAQGPQRMYYCQLYNSSNVLSLDLIPCYRKLDSVVGMYDLVNNQFYTNAGSGAFIKGGDVS